MNYYIKDDLEFMTRSLLPELTQVEELSYKGEVYYLYSDKSYESQGLHIIEDVEFLNNNYEILENKLSILNNNKYSELIKNNKLIGVNILKIKLEDVNKKDNKKYKVNVLGLGDVGGTMLTGLRLLGGNTISKIGIFDLDENKVKRWSYELNQIKSIDRGPFPDVVPVIFDNIFDCDVFIFTASTQIPEVGSEVKDVRMFQLESNSKIISIYAKKAKEVGYKGKFLVVSDPVDLLCKATLIHSDGGLLPEQIKGFGLGVMHARASFYSKDMNLNYFDEKGRAYGPHGKDLIIADNIFDYNDSVSKKLTEKTIHANLDIRDFGYKPFIAPAMSSAALSILGYLNDEYHHSTVYLDGVYFGCKNKKIGNSRIVSEKNIMDKILMDRLNKTFEELKSFEFTSN